MSQGSPSPAAVLDVTEPTLLRVPFEALKRAAKDRKAVIDEAQVGNLLQWMLHGMLTPLPDNQEACAAALNPAVNNPEAAGAAVESIITRLQSLKRKLEDVSEAERTGAAQCKARLEHLQLLTQPRVRGSTHSSSR